MVNVGDDYHFLLRDAGGFEAPESMFRNMQDAEGHTYLCVTEECKEDDLRLLRADFGQGGGKGG